MAERNLKKRVVMTGMGAVNPAGNNLQETWRNFLTSECFISSEALPIGDRRSLELAAVVSDFDVYRYGASRQVKRSDMFAHYGMAAGVEAMLQSGRLVVKQASKENLRAEYTLLQTEVVKTDPKRLGVIYGIAAGGTRQVQQVAEDLLRRLPSEDAEIYSIPMLNPARAATDTARMIGARAGAFSINSACASGAQAIWEAYLNVANGRWDVAVAGGAETAVHAVTFEAFRRMGVLLPYNPSQIPNLTETSYGTATNGIVIGNGAGALVLERASDAIARRAHIFAEIVGGHFFTEPNAELDPTVNHIEELIGTALEYARVKPDEVDHANTHAAGSKRGDLRELEGYEKVLKERTRMVSITGLKSKIAHLMGAAGVIESIGAVKAIEEGIVPPTVNLRSRIPDGFHIVTLAERRHVGTVVKTSLGLDGQYGCLVFKKFVA